jgi:hypothetical protein
LNVLSKFFSNIILCCLTHFIFTTNYLRTVKLNRKVIYSMFHNLKITHESRRLLSSLCVTMGCGCGDLCFVEISTIVDVVRTAVIAPVFAAPIVEFPRERARRIFSVRRVRQRLWNRSLKNLFNNAKRCCEFYHTLWVSEGKINFGDHNGAEMTSSQTYNSNAS